MASLGLGLAGSALFGPVGGFIGATAGAVIDSFLFPPEDRTTEGPRLDDLRVTSSAHGKPIPLIYGTMRVGGNVDWSPGIVEHRREETEGGKGGPEITTVTFLYTASFGVTWGEGPAQAILKTWLDKKLAQDFTVTGVQQGSLVGELISGGGAGAAPGNQAVRHYLGTETQKPDPTEQADRGVANTPAYRGRIRSVFQDLPLENFGNRIPQPEALVAMVATEAQPSTTLEGSQVSVLNAAVVRPDLQRLIATGADSSGAKSISVIDLVNKTEISAKTFNLNINDNFFKGVDRAGNIYFIARNTPVTDTDTLYKVDGLTLEVLATLELSGQNSDALERIDTLVAGDPPNEFVLIEHSAGKLTAAVAEPLHLLVQNLSLGNYVNSAGMTKDGLGRVWLCHDDGSDTYLTRVTAAGGIEDIFAVTDTGSPPASITGINQVGYEPNTNSLILADSANKIYRWSLDDEATDGEISATIRLVEATVYNGPRSDGRIWFNTADTGLRQINLVTMEDEGFLANTSWDGIGGFTIDEAIYDPLNDAVIRDKQVQPSFQVYWFYLDRKSGDAITVRSIVEDVSSRVGLNVLSDIDAAALIDTLPGYIVNQRMAARRALEPLAATFFFRSVESDFAVKLPKRGGAVSFALPEQDLGARSDPERDVIDIEEVRRQEVELPAVVDLTFLDPAIDYQSNTQRAQRVSGAVDTRRQLATSFPGALSTQQAAGIAERRLYLEWINRSRFNFHVDWGHIRLDPADVGTVTKDGATFTLELERTDFGADGVIRVLGMAEDEVVHASSAVGADALGVPQQSLTLGGPTALYLLDVPLLRDADDGLGIYLAAGAFNDGVWPGAAVVKSHDGVDFSIAFSAVRATRNAEHGFATTALQDANPRVWDRTNTVTVRLFRGDLFSDSEPNVLSGSNALLIGDEIVMFATAIANANGTYTLSTLLRGRRGTDWATGSHVTGERVVVLSEATVQREIVPEGDIGVERWYRGVTVGSPLGSGMTKVIRFTGRSQRPYAPVDIRGLVGSPGDWLITWKRRGRLFAAWRDRQDIPLGEASEAYEVDILEPGSPETVVRTLMTATTQVVYDTTQQVADFGAEQNRIMVRIYQRNEVVGRGFAGRAVLEDGRTLSWAAEVA